MSQLDRPDVGFVACIEGGVLEAQTLLLFESIRRYAGRFRECSLYALSPRSGHGISDSARARLNGLGAVYSDTVLNTECPEYGPANRVAAAAHVEDKRAHDVLVVVDSDALILREPVELALPADIDAAVRPVDVKGLSTSGPGDAFDGYWLDLCRSSGVDYDQIPWGQSFVDRRRIKANYNGGFVVVRGGLGILRRCADVFFGALRRGLHPRSAADGFRTGVGWIEPEAARLWGTSQAALSVALWSTTRRIRELSPTYNYPLHLHDQVDSTVARSAFPQLVHVHYHWLLAADSLPSNPLLGESGPLSPEQREWLRTATPVG